MEKKKREEKKKKVAAARLASILGTCWTGNRIFLWTAWEGRCVWAPLMVCRKSGTYSSVQ